MPERLLPQWKGLYSPLPVVGALGSSSAQCPRSCSATTEAETRSAYWPQKDSFQGAGPPMGLPLLSHNASLIGKPSKARPCEPAPGAHRCCHAHRRAHAHRGAHTLSGRWCRKTGSRSLSLSLSHSPSLSLSIYVHTYVYTCVHMCIYIYRERPETLASTSLPAQ